MPNDTAKRPYKYTRVPRNKTGKRDRDRRTREACLELITAAGRMKTSDLARQLQARGLPKTNGLVRPALLDLEAEGKVVCERGPAGIIHFAALPGRERPQRKPAEGTLLDWVARVAEGSKTYERGCGAPRSGGWGKWS